MSQPSTTPANDQQSDKSKVICALNDLARRVPQAANARWVMTPGIVSLTGDDATGQVNPLKRLTLIRTVRDFDAFDAENDPHSEHDFGSFLFDGEKVYFKIDYYNLDCSGGSEDPASTAKCCRVVTILLASEY